MAGAVSHKVSWVHQEVEMEFRARGLLGAYSWERKRGKEEVWSRRASECSAGLTKSWPTQQGTLEHKTPIRGIPCWAEWLGPCSPANEVGDFLGRVWPLLELQGGF